MSTRIQLLQQSSLLHCSWLPKDSKDYYQVVSHWKAERQIVRGGEPSNNMKEIVEYVVTKTRDSAVMEIQWKRPRPTPPK